MLNYSIRIIHNLLGGIQHGTAQNAIRINYHIITRGDLLILITYIYRADVPLCPCAFNRTKDIVNYGFTYCDWNTCNLNGLFSQLRLACSYSVWDIDKHASLILNSIRKHAQIVHENAYLLLISNLHHFLPTFQRHCLKEDMVFDVKAIFAIALEITWMNNWTFTAIRGTLVLKSHRLYVSIHRWIWVNGDIGC